MESLLNDFDRVCHARLAELAEQTAEGIPLIGYNGDFIPEEMLRAMGVNTCLVLFGGDCKASELAEGYMMECINPLARANVGYLLSGSIPLMKATNMFAFAFADNHEGHMSEILEYKGFNVCKIGIPVDWEKEIAFQYYIRALQRLLANVEAISGKQMDREEAVANFQAGNRLNALFRRINSLRKTDAVPIGAEDYFRLQHFSFLLNREEDLQLLEQFVLSLERTPARFNSQEPRLILMGRAVAVGDYTIMRMLDETGCPVVAEIMDEGVRNLDSDICTDGDLLENFAAARYHRRVPISNFKPSWKQRYAALQKLITEYRADGVVWYQLANDEIYDILTLPTLF